MKSVNNLQFLTPLFAQLTKKSRITPYFTHCYQLLYEKLHRFNTMKEKDTYLDPVFPAGCQSSAGVPDTTFTRN